MNASPASAHVDSGRTSVAGVAPGCRTAWTSSTEASAAESIPELPARSEVVIVGGGITGLTLALHLLKAGRQVTVLEQDAPGAGTTGRSSAHLTTLIDSGIDSTERMFSAEANRMVHAAMAAAIDQIEAWSRDYSIDCDFERVPGYYFTEDEDGVKTLESEAAACRRAGLAAVDEASPPMVTARAAFRLDRQGIFDPAAYAQGLADTVARKGGLIFPHTRVIDFQDGEPCCAESTRGRIECDHLVLATHTPLGRSMLHGELSPQRSYLIAAELDQDFPNALFWDTEEPYHYLRRIDQPAEPPLLLVGGADHKTGEMPPERNPWDTLEAWTRTRFQIKSVKARWSAQFYAPVDGFPYVGRSLSDSHVYVATGFNGDGLTLGTASGRLLADIILGHENELAELLSPRRLKLKAAAQAVKLNLQAARHYLFGRSGKVEAKPGEGVVHQVRAGVEAHYHAPDGSVHRFSAICPHMKCIVQWNPLEHSWDCPCHGGRFSALGERLEGPPSSNLHPATRADTG